MARKTPTGKTETGKTAGNPERARLDEEKAKRAPWKKWGPYLSERQWGTVREDYSDSGNAWDYFTHDQARSRAYRWGEDGIAGYSDDKQFLCFALALWNGTDPILKERLFGLSNSEGNHGEDVKEYYFYLDSTPTHSYMKYLYKYPQRPFPYEDLVRTNRARGRHELEYELLDTGAFDEERYFDVFVEYAKSAPEDTLVRVTAWNRGPVPASLHVLPTLWFRNIWSDWSEGAQKPSLAAVDLPGASRAVEAEHAFLGTRYLYCDGGPTLLFTENETNNERVFGSRNATPFVKDAFHEYVVRGRGEAVNPERTGTKSAAHYSLEILPGESRTVRLRLSDAPPPSLPKAGKSPDPFKGFDETFADRVREADAFYESITPPSVDEDGRRVMRQALAGMLWGKQYYYFDLSKWLKEHDAHPLTTAWRQGVRNRDWFHMANDDVISMPDKWEYPWYAAWDLAFHTIALSIVDLPFAKRQLDLMLRELYLHPSGQIPAYEWNFGDVNPPVHPWATWFIYQAEKESTGKGDVAFLKSAFHKLLLNFTWWVNRKDRNGRNVFEGGFLGLDNIGVFDRSSPLPTGGYLEQADGTAWMALFSQNMLDIALELADHDPAYEEMAAKFVEHVLYISAAIDRIGEHHDEMWDEEDGFFYDVLRLPDGNATRLKVRSMVGLLPLCAVSTFPGDVLRKFPRFLEQIQMRRKLQPELLETLAFAGQEGVGGRRILALLDEKKLRRVLARLLDEGEFLSPYGIRALSRHHAEHPYVFHVNGQEFRVSYLPGDSDSGMFGGNSNWRGPIWFPVNALIVRALLQYYRFLGNDFTVECPTGSGRRMTLFEVAREIGRRLTAIFLRGPSGRRPVYGEVRKFQEDPHWRDLVLFYEYFHGDSGAGIGASHQTGWTGLVAKLIQMFSDVSGEHVLKTKSRGALIYRGKPQEG
jgi:hypothetical protein